MLFLDAPEESIDVDSRGSGPAKDPLEGEGGSLYITNQRADSLFYFDLSQLSNAV